jgi:hypothetical protein
MTAAAQPAPKLALLTITSARVSEDRATIGYRFTSTADRNLYLFHRLWEEIGADLVFQTSVHRAYVEIVPDGVLLSKKAVPVPPNMAVEQPNLPCVSRVEPGGSIAEEMEIPLPLVPRTPYLRAPKADQQTETRLLDAWFEVGFLAVPPEGDRLAVAASTSDGPALRFNGITIRSQVLLRAPLSLQLPVRLPG